MSRIAIFPASGGLGASTYTHLLSLVPPQNVTLISRDPSKIPTQYTAAGAKTVQASYESRTADLEAAFTGADILFLISYPSHVHDYRVHVQLPAIDAARRAGVKHVFYSSLGYAGQRGRESKAVVMQAHLDTEAYLARLAAEDPSQFSYTAIREGLYSESYPIYTSFFSPQAPDDGIIRIPHDGSAPGIAWVKKDELGEASAKLIAGYATSAPASFTWKNEVMLLTGPRAWTLNETAEALSKIAGREVRIEEVGLEEYVRQKGNVEKFGGDETLMRSWATAFDGVRAGECAVVTSTLGQILGREPEAFDVTIARGVGLQDKP